MPGKKWKPGYRKIATNRKKLLLQIYNCIAKILTSTQVQVKKFNLYRTQSLRVQCNT